MTETGFAIRVARYLSRYLGMMGHDDGIRVVTQSTSGGDDFLRFPLIRFSILFSVTAGAFLPVICLIPDA